MLMSPIVIPANVVTSIYNRSQGSGVTYSWHSQPGNPLSQSEPQRVEDNRLTADEPGGCSIAQRGQLNACRQGKETSCATERTLYQALCPLPWVQAGERSGASSSPPSSP